MAEFPGYRLVFSDSAETFFISLTRRRQRKLLDRAHEWAADPFLAPDFRDVDADGRELAHVRVDGFIFIYWVDHAVKRVMVTDVDDAE
ncbi:MAG: hypothetical protein H7343_14195 [Undibacterium sp.]|nr:hypothetical protein [Opitutaceae bacterium]